MWALYQALFVIGFVLMLPKFLIRMARRGGYRASFAERFARYSPEIAARLQGTGRLWVHAVSVGEAHVGLAFMREWRARHPGARFVLTVNTPTGRGVAAPNLGADDVLVTFPLDTPPIIRRALDAIRPSALILCEGEIWPNLIRACAARGTPVAIVNARMSDRSFRGYRAARPFTRRVLNLVSVVCAQGESDAERFVALGAPPDRVVVEGSVKYDVATPDPAASASAQAFLRGAGFPADAQLIVGGSTWPGEEAALLDAWLSMRADSPGSRLVLVPRHAERAGAVAREIEARGLSYVRRSGGGGRPAEAPQVALIDTTGELMGFYGAADIVFVGKSLTDHGGQNPIEPAIWGRPIVCGPNMENFRPVVADFDADGALTRVADAGELAAALRRLLADPALRMDLSERARRVAVARAGAMRRTVDTVERWINTPAGGNGNFRRPEIREPLAESLAPPAFGGRPERDGK